MCIYYSKHPFYISWSYKHGINDANKRMNVAVFTPENLPISLRNQ